MSQDDPRARHIRRYIRRAEKRLYERWPLLAHRNAIGAGLCVLSAAGMVLLGWLYWRGEIPAVVCILGNAFLASILHELEHDLIHVLYFTRKSLAHNAMMFTVWLFRGNVPHGWYRRGIHFHHHEVSGSVTDVEERVLGLGTRWGLKRLLVSPDAFLTFLFNARQLEREIPDFRARHMALATFPLYPIFLAVLGGFLGYHALTVAGVPAPALLAAAYPWLEVLAVAWVFPNLIRQASLQIVTSNVHYYGDVHTIHEQTQMLRPFYLWPLQLFCFNFGTTHCFHHYVVDQPFYIRQLISPAVVPYLRRAGVRENDTGTFLRANRFETA